MPTNVHEALGYLFSLFSLRAGYLHFQFTHFAAFFQVCFNLVWQLERLDLMQCGAARCLLMAIIFAAEANTFLS